MLKSNTRTQQPVLIAGQRQTAQRQQIFNTLEGATGPLTVGQIFELVRREVPDVGLATVYRALKLLLKSKQIRLVTLLDGVARYEKVGRGPDHFHCRSCEGIWTLQSGAVTSPGVNRLGDGFLVEDHETTLHGQCPNCGSSSSTTSANPR